MFPSQASAHLTHFARHTVGVCAWRFDSAAQPRRTKQDPGRTRWELAARFDEDASSVQQFSA
jgi:hypothetical protein